MRIHFDYHNQPNIPDLAADFNAELLASLVRRTGADSVNLFLQCNQGYCYFTTNTGAVYPGLERDIYGEALKAMHKKGIAVIGYINVALNHRLALERSEWLRRDADGRTLTAPPDDPFCRTMCINSGYGEWLLGLVAEALALYPETDGIFADNLLPLPCFCPKCRADMQALGVDPDDSDAAAEFARVKAVEFAERLRALCGARTLDIKGMSHSDTAWISDTVYLPCMPRSEGSDAFAVQALFSCSETGKSCFLDGRFITGWGDFGGMRGGNELYSDACDALLYGTGFCLGDHLHPRAMPDGAMYDEYNPALKLYSSLEKFVRAAKPLRFSAVLSDDGGVTPGAASAAEMLLEGHRLFDIIGAGADFSQYRLLILPDDLHMTSALAAKLREYKGKILSAGAAPVLDGEFIDPRWDCVYRGEDGDSASFYSYSGRIVAARCGGILFTSGKSQFCPRISAYNQRGVSGGRPYFYTPPDAPDGFCAVSCNNRAAHIGFNVFTAYSEYGDNRHRSLVLDVVSLLSGDDDIVFAGLPASARVGAFTSPDGLLVAVKLVLAGGELPVLSPRCRILIRGKYNGVRLLNGDFSAGTVQDERGYSQFVSRSIPFALYLLN